MTQDDYDGFCEVVIGFAELKGKQLSAPAVELFWHAMRHWPLDAFRAAAEQLLRTCQFMPTPKDFQDLLRAGEHTAGEAWDAVYLGRGVVTERARRAAEIASSGRRLGMLDIEREVPHVQRRFIEIYNELTDVEHTRAALPDLEEVIARIRTDGLRRIGAPKKPQ